MTQSTSTREILTCAKNVQGTYRVAYDGHILGDSRGFSSEELCQQEISRILAKDARDAITYNRPLLYALPEASTVLARTVREINIAIGAVSTILDLLDADIRDLRANRADDAVIDADLTKACNRHTTWCGIFADLHAERAEAQAFEDHLDELAEAERVLELFRLDQRL